MWFLTIVHECLGGLKLVIMFDRNKGALYTVPKVFGWKPLLLCETFEG